MSFNLQSSKLGVITVFDAKVYKPLTGTTWSSIVTWFAGKTATQVIAEAVNSDAAVPVTPKFNPAAATITSLKMSNLLQAGPELTIQGGVRNNTLIKHGKSVRCEMQDALANVDALVAMGGAEITSGALTVTEKFGSPVMIIGTTIMIDEATGAEKTAKIVIYQFLPDSILSINLGADSAATFDLNGDVLSTEITKVTGTTGKVFYSAVITTEA